MKKLFTIISFIMSVMVIVNGVTKLPLRSAMQTTGAVMMPGGVEVNFQEMMDNGGATDEQVQAYANAVGKFTNMGNQQQQRVRPQQQQQPQEESVGLSGLMEQQAKPQEDKEQQKQQNIREMLKQQRQKRNN